MPKEIFESVQPKETRTKRSLIGSCGSCPSGSCPSGSCPSGSCPSGSCPSGSCPSGSCPSGSCPSCINIALLCFALLLWFLWTARPPIKETDPLRWRSVMSYQVYLNSASSTDVYPENTNSSFRVQLPKQLDTKGYKCALGEICFVNDVLSVPDTNFITTTNVEKVRDVLRVDCTSDENLEKRILEAFDGKLRYSENRYVAVFDQPTTVTLGPKLEWILGTVESVSGTTVEFSKKWKITSSDPERNYLMMRWTHYDHLWYRLPGEIAVYIDYEVPLSQVMPVTFKNGRYYPLPELEKYELSENLEKFFAFHEDHTEEDVVLVRDMRREKTASIPSIKYDSDEHVFKALEAALVGVDCKAEFDQITSRITLVLDPGVELRMSESLALFLGFGTQTHFAGTTTAKTPVSINYRSNTIFVKCSIVAHSIVSHVLSRNLRVFPLENSQSTMIHKTFLDKQYFSIDQDAVDSVHVSLLTEFGEKLFLNDSTISTWLTLHFVKDDGS